MPPPPAIPTITGNVGSTCCFTSWLFSVVNSNSKPVGSIWPAPTPSAYSSESFDVHEFLPGCETAPTESKFIGIRTSPLRELREHARGLGRLRHELGNNLRQLRRLP